MNIESIGTPSRLLNLARKFNNFYLNVIQKNPEHAIPFLVNGHRLGSVFVPVIEQMNKHPDIFTVTNDGVKLNDRFRTYNERTEVLSQLLEIWRERDCFFALRGWRDENYEIKCRFDDTAALEMERSAISLFGFRSFGVHINGYVREPTKGLCLWIQQRSDNKPTWPSKYDNMVGGGITAKECILETVRREIAEEAGITSEKILEKLQPAGSVSFMFESPRGVHANTEFVFDLELPLNYVPFNTDGEVQKFLLMSVQETLELILTDKFKTTSCPIALDFLIRHGFINSQNEENIKEIIELLHVPIHNIYK